jgi:hypothetical protein
MILELEDYSPPDLALICEKTANEKFKLKFEDGMRDKLAKHIEDHHSHEIATANGGLAVTLTERAFRRLAMRLGRSDSVMAAHGTDASILIPEDFEIGLQRTWTRKSLAQAGCVQCPCGNVFMKDAKFCRKCGLKRGGTPDPKSPGKGVSRQSSRSSISRKEAFDKAADLLKSLQDDDEPLAEDDASLTATADRTKQNGDDDDNDPDRSPPERQKAVAKAMSKTKDREKNKEAPQEKPEEALPIQEGEKVLDQMDTLDALNALGCCPASYEWYQIDIYNPPSANCGICSYRLQEGFRCGGGTHFTCMDCINEYKTQA